MCYMLILVNHKRLMTPIRKMGLFRERRVPVAEIKEIALALAKAQSKFPSIPKNKTAKVVAKTGRNYEYKYADIADVLSAVRPVLSSLELSLTQTVVRTESGYDLITSLLHSSGQHIDSFFPLPLGLHAQELGTLLTYYRRYFACALLGIAAEEDLDGEDDSDDDKRPPIDIKPTAPQTAQAPKGAVLSAVVRPNVVSPNKWAPPKDLDPQGDVGLDFSTKMAEISKAQTFFNWQNDSVVTYCQKAYKLHPTQLDGIQYAQLLATLRALSWTDAMKELDQEIPDFFEGSPG